MEQLEQLEWERTLSPLKGSLSTVLILNDKKKMKYDISKTTAPTMPKLGRGLESVALLLSQVSKDMHQPIVPMLFPILGAHVSGAEFMYLDKSWKEMCRMLANLVADSGTGKGPLVLMFSCLNKKTCSSVLMSFKNMFSCSSV